MTATDETPPVTKADLKAIGQALSEAMAEINQGLAGLARNMRERAAVADLFQLSRLWRATTDAEASAELETRWREAIDTLGTEMLAELVVFAQRLERDARPVWLAREH